jgi:hypothetical protein
MLIDCTVERRIDDEGRPIGRWAILERDGVSLYANGEMSHTQCPGGEFRLPTTVEESLGVKGVRLKKVPKVKLHKMTYSDSIAVFTMVVDDKIKGKSFFLPLNHSEVLAFIIESVRPIDIVGGMTPDELERWYKSIL